MKFEIGFVSSKGHAISCASERELCQSFDSSQETSFVPSATMQTDFSLNAHMANHEFWSCAFHPRDVWSLHVAEEVQAAGPRLALLKGLGGINRDRAAKGEVGIALLPGQGCLKF